MRVLVAGAWAVTALLLQSGAAHATPTDTVVICELTAEKSFSRRDLSVDEATQKPRAIHKEFVLKFDDTEKRVTYIAGPGIAVKPPSNSRELDKAIFEDTILFLGDSGIVFNNLIMRYSGEISRLTGKIVLRTIYLNANDWQRSYAEPEIEQTGTCSAGPRKF